MSSNASPLAVPAPVPESSSPLADMLATLHTAMPGMDAEVAHAVATTSQTADQALQNGQAAQGFQVSSNNVQFLQKQSQANQLAYWRGLGDGQQQMLRSAGYHPPGQHRGLFGDISHGLGIAVHDTLNDIGSPLRAVQHGVRTAFALANQNPNDPMGGSWSDLISALHSPGEWAKAWDETSSGQSYVLPQVQQQVRNLYGEQTYQLAMKMASGVTIPQIMKGLNQTQQDALMQTIQSDPHLHQAINLLGAGHVSTGRMLARSVGLTPNSPMWNTISGITDATVDWFGDPTIVGAKAAGAVRAARYLVGTGEDVRRAYETNSGVKNAMTYIADRVNAAQAGDKAAVGDLHQAFPKLAPIIPDLVKDRTAITAAGVREHFADNATLTRLITHNPAELPGITGGTWMPKLSYAGQARLAVKGTLTKAVDWMADQPASFTGLKEGDVIDHPLNGGPVTKIASRPLAGIGQFLRAVTTLTPKSEFDPYDPNWLNNLRNVAKMALPSQRVNSVLHDFSMAADVGAKRALYVNLMKEIFTRLGVADSPAGSRWLTDFARGVDNPASLQKYSTSGADIMKINGQVVPEGIDENHLTTAWAVPDYRVLYAQAKKVGITHSLMGLPNAGFVDNVMQRIWKPLTLARVGFAMRVAGEEAFGALLRQGPAAYLKSRASLSAMKPFANLDKNHPLLNKAGQVWEMLTSHLPQKVVDGIKTPTDLITENLGDATQRAMKNVQAALPAQKYKDAIRRGQAHNVFGDPFAEQVSAAHGHGAGYLDGDMWGQPIEVFHQGKIVKAQLRDTGAFKGYESTNELFSWAWWRQLREIAGSHWDRTAMATGDKPLADRIKAVADEIEKNPKMAERSPRWHQTSDDRKVGEEVTRRQAVEDWAAKLIQHVDSVTRTPLGAHIEVTPGTSLVDHLMDVKKPPSAALLDMTPSSLRPLSVKGPANVAMLEGGTGFFTRSVNRMFDVIGRQINWISRQPMYLHNFTVSLDALEPQAKLWRAAGMKDSEVERNTVMAARDRAVELTTPYIHNPELRSQFAQITRNLSPFWFAQEQFYKRWARNMKYSPWAFRQAQLINQGVAHSGFVHKDPTTGQEYFVYPAANIVQDVLSRSLTAFGYKSWLPINAALRGQVNQASPGLERLGLPSLGPLAVIPLNVVKQVFPELKPPIDAAEGQQAASSSFIKALVPSTISRIWQDFSSSPNNSAQYASAMMQAVQYLEATGHGIGTVANNNIGSVDQQGQVKLAGDFKPGDFVTNANGVEYVYQPDGGWRRNDPAEMKTYEQRIKNWTRIFLITRTIFGFNAPASPENLFDPGHVNEDLQQALKTLPFQDALAVFMKEHPDANAYTVFQTATQAGEPLPATADAMNFLDANKTFMGNHPLAGAYFLPQSDTTGKFDLKAYQSQLTEQLRLRKTPAEFWKEISYGEAASQYYAAEDRKNQLMSSGGGMSKAQIENMWTQESQAFLQANPLFAQQLGVTPDTPGSLLGGSTTYTRANLLTDLASALNDPQAPENQHTENIRTMVNSFIAYQTQTTPYGAAGSASYSSAFRHQIEVQYADAITGWVAQHPDVQALYNRLIRPALSSVLSAEAAAQI